MFLAVDESGRRVHDHIERLAALVSQGSRPQSRPEFTNSAETHVVAHDGTIV